VKFSYIGYESVVIEIDLAESKSINVELFVKSVNLNEVVVETERGDENVTSTQMGTSEIIPKEIKTIPVFMGEQDILKTIQLMPGVSQAGDGNSGFFVRGGNTDQNLILLDEATVYNASHLLGFFSVFNSDAIKNAKLIKGSMPPEYGGRLHSVLDISMKEGNMRRFQVNGGIGLISSRLTVEGPIEKDKGSFLISGRFIALFPALNMLIESRYVILDQTLLGQLPRSEQSFMGHWLARIWAVWSETMLRKSYGANISCKSPLTS